MPHLKNLPGLYRVNTGEEININFILSTSE